MRTIKQLTVMVVMLLVASSTSFAQEYVFKVLAKKGSVEIKMGDNLWQSLKTGSSLTKDDQIRVNEEAYLGLVHSTGRTKEIKEAGEYLVENLEKQINLVESTLVKKYSDFLLSKMTEDEADLDKDYRDYQLITGAVTRTIFDTNLKLYMPKSVDIIGSKMFIRWTEVGTDITYVLKVTNLYDDELKSIKTSDISTLIDLEEGKLKGESQLILTVSVEDKDIKSIQHSITRMGVEDAKSVKDKLSQLEEEMPDNTALKNLIIASFFEDEGLLGDALTMYEAAIELDPEVEAFKVAYVHFLTRHGLNK